MKTKRIGAAVLIFHIVLAGTQEKPAAQHEERSAANNQSQESQDVTLPGGGRVTVNFSVGNSHDVQSQNQAASTPTQIAQKKAEPQAAQQPQVIIIKHEYPPADSNSTAKTLGFAIFGGAIQFAVAIATRGMAGAGAIASTATSSIIPPAVVRTAAQQKIFESLSPGLQAILRAKSL